jgi:hypothetical protein
MPFENMYPMTLYQAECKKAVNYFTLTGIPEATGREVCPAGRGSQAACIRAVDALTSQLTKITEIGYNNFHV